MSVRALSTLATVAPTFGRWGSAQPAHCEAVGERRLQDNTVISPLNYRLLHDTARQRMRLKTGRTRSGSFAGNCVCNRFAISSREAFISSHSHSRYTCSGAECFTRPDSDKLLVHVSILHPSEETSRITTTNKQTPWPLVRERTISTERPPLVDEI
jgi:hypothetical protein